MKGGKGVGEWALPLDPEWRMRHVAKCLACGELSIDMPTAGDARGWCLTHARDTGCGDRFEVTAFWYLGVGSGEPPSVNGTSPT